MSTQSGKAVVVNKTPPITRMVSLYNLEAACASLIYWLICNDVGDDDDDDDDDDDNWWEMMMMMMRW